MEIRQLKYFVEIVESGSFSKAAGKLYIAQPALSKQIKLLEGELGVPLLTRTTSGIRPTESGSLFYRHAQLVLRQLQRATRQIVEANAAPSGPVVLGMPQTVAGVLAAPLVFAVSRKYPGIQLQIREGMTGMLQEMVQNGELDIGVLFDRPCDRPELRVVPLLTEALYVLTAVGIGPDRDTITLREAAEFRYILPAKNNTTRQIAEHAFSKQDLQLKLLAEVDTASSIKSVVRTGLGATILSGSGAYADFHDSELKVRKIVEPQLERAVCLYSYDADALTIAAQAVLEEIPVVVRRLLADKVWAVTSLLGSTVEGYTQKLYR